MFKLERLLSITCVLLLNLPTIKADMADFLSLMKTAEEFDCIKYINEEGAYTFNDGSGPSNCGIAVDVPAESVVYVQNAGGTTCEPVTSTLTATLSADCGTPLRVTVLANGLHVIYFKPTKQITIRVKYTRVVILGCGDWAKNLFDFVNTTIIFVNDSNNKYCMVQLPPSLEIEWLDYETNNKKKPCCPDVFVASTDIAQNPISYSESFSACDLRTKRPKVITRCEGTFMYLRQSAKNDRVMFRVVQRPKNTMEKCVPTGQEVEPDDFICHKKPKMSKKTKNQSPFIF